MKLNSTALRNIKPNKTALLVAIPVVLLLAVFVLGAIESHRQHEVAAAQDSSVAKQLSDSQQAVAKLTAAQKAADDKLASEQAKTAATCQYVKQLDAIPALTARVTVPAQCL